MLLLRPVDGFASAQAWFSITTQSVGSQEHLNSNQTNKGDKRTTAYLTRVTTVELPLNSSNVLSSTPVKVGISSFVWVQFQPVSCGDEATRVHRN